MQRRVVLRRRRWLCPCLVSALLGCTFAAGVHARDRAALADLPLEQLREIVVSTVSRRAETLALVAAGVYVVTAEEIRRSGATTLPEALRLVPTLAVARADANQYAISARGFNNVLANKMLVLIDGRTVYTPLFSGVFWEAQDVLLEDVERIEVVTGPSTALWGSNAVNGLIHVITRSAARTQGLLLGAHGGNREHGLVARYGGAARAGAAYRIYAKGYERRPSERADGTPVRDEADGAQVGFRADWTGRRDSLVVLGDTYRATIDQAPRARQIRGTALLARWQRGGPADDRQATLQAVVERTQRNHPGTFAETLDTVDLVGQVGRRLGRHRLVLGAGVRRADDEVDHGAAFAFLPPDKTLSWERVFVQDQFALASHLELTLAASVERSTYTGTEALPSLRLAWRHGSGLLWGALSRAVRAPSRIDREFFLPAQPPHTLAGGPDFRSEVSHVAELGYRAQPSPATGYSVTVFHHEHRHLRSLAPTPQGLELRNDIEGHTQGLSAWATWRVSARWRLTGGALLLHDRLSVRAGAQDVGGLQALGNDPAHQWSLRSALDLPGQIEWDVAVRRVGALPDPHVPAYTAVDSRLAWRPTRQTEIALVGRNLLDAGHVEWGTAAARAEFGAAWSLQWRWRP